MKWGSYWSRCLLAAIGLVLPKLPIFQTTDASSPLLNAGWTSQRKLAAREKTRDLWYHGFDNYMMHAFPMDELAPLSCTGQGPDWSNPANIAANDVAGNFSLTLIDVLDSFVVLDDRQGFERAVRNIIENVVFDVNTKPQVFETTIRVLGGLLSGHIYASDEDQPFNLPWYRGELLTLAHDLGERLLPAFSTATGIPFARVNLRHGVMKGETTETCTAGAGSLILEFGTLSRLTGDDRFEKAAKRAFFGIWNRRSDIGLVGNTINSRDGKWTPPTASGIGAGVDSFYEYALKWYIMSGELEFLDVWDDAYAAIMRYSRALDGYWYRPVNMNTGDLAYYTVDSLSAFWPGLQVLSGDVENAIKLHMLYYNLWKQHAGLPEVYDTNFRVATSHQYPLRPEFIESTWYLYRATKDPFYLDVGERVLFDLTTRAKVPCGLTGIQDLRSNKQDDRMESFALSETLKYLYLLFDEENSLNHDDSDYVLTTEGHILKLSDKHKALSKTTRKYISHQCPAYIPHGREGVNPTNFLWQGVRSRPHVEYARALVGGTPSESEKALWSPDGWCEKPKVDIYSYEFILAANGETAPEDLSPSLLKLAPVHDGFVIHNITGIRTKIIQRLDAKGYDVRKLGHYSVRPGHIVYINDTAIFSGSGGKKDLSQTEQGTRDQTMELHLTSFDVAHPASSLQRSLGPLQVDVVVTASTAMFGAELGDVVDDLSSQRLSSTRSLPIFHDKENSKGCGPYEDIYPDSVLVVHRGTCSFLEKLKQARDAFAVAVIVISDEDELINPSSDAEDLLVAGNIDDTALVLVANKVGVVLLGLLDVAEDQGSHQLVVSPFTLPASLTQAPIPTPTAPSDPEDTSTQGLDSPRILYINGHPLLNTRLLV
ncbi:alpha mannosidase-like protein [Coprinopsis marcescibilis]|uniref:alpha-1,2-Mannosidase n=1 Tax=Coprinopsis marcescibilis TaxID=230819 RepID=A0A5C3L850_COPMA|nr:alpha mannosidase-like protein [Coprinopsis marcescibilis]